MSTESRTAPSGGRESAENHPSQPYPPHFYPANYQGLPQPPWFPGQPPTPAVSGPWPAPWGHGGPVASWPIAQTGGKATSNTSSVPSDEYTVDTMRRIYNDDDGRVEIQRVKVQRRHPEAPAATFPTSTDAMSLVPFGAFPLNERRPPPRKNKIKKQMQLMQSLQGQPGSYPCYPYMPCMPYPYPYPYYYGGGCMWPPGVVSPPMSPWPGSDDSDRTISRQESLPTTMDSQRLEFGASATSRNSLSPSPSDSASAFGYNEESLKLSIRSPTPPPRLKSRGARALMAPSDASSDAGDRNSFATASTDIVPYKMLPPRRKNRASKTLSVSDQCSPVDRKDIDSISDRTSITSDMTGDEPFRISSELDYAFKKFEKSVDVFKTKISVDSTPVNTPPPSPPPMIVHSSSTADESKTLTDSDRIPSPKLEDYETSTLSSSPLPPLETAPEIIIISLPPSNITDAEVMQDVSHTVTSNQEEVSKPVINSNTPTIANSVFITEAPTIPDAEVSLSPSVTDKPSQETVSTSMPLVEAPAEPHLENSQIEGKKDGKESESSKRQEIQIDDVSGRESRASSSTFFSLRPSDDPLHLDTDSTDILLPTTDVTTADEDGDGTDWPASSPMADDPESYQWVLQQPGEIPDLDCSSADLEDERRNAWRAEVSLWRARLVVSLCRGRGLDRQDWATFHLLVHHPLTLDLKLSMLHAPRLCIANSTIGAALVRVALIHLAQRGEMLLQPEAERQHGWKSIKVDPNQSWAPVKGAVEILKSLGYREKEDGLLRYPRRSGPEVSVLARLTLDMLVLAEELRLYLTGTHQYPTNISDLFFPTSVISPSPVDGAQAHLDVARPPSSTGSYSFMSAHSNASLNNRSESRASSVTDEDTETLQVSVRHNKSHSKKVKRTSSSEEEVTLIEDIGKKHLVPQVSKISSQEAEKKDKDQVHADNSSQSKLSSGSAVSHPASSLLDNAAPSICSLPDLQSIKSSTVSLISQPLKTFDSNGSVTPIATPTPDKDNTKDNPEEHIYEEIDVIRQQVQALRSSSVPVDIQPPPLPPKKKVNSCEDDSGLSLTYPHMEWTSSSMPGSLRGGSTGARRKKRRAPMPPDFMPQDWKPYENRPEEGLKAGARDSPVDGRRSRTDQKRGLNPFYEDIDSVRAKAYEKRRIERSAKGNDEGNPFNQEDFVVSGYIGKNPFYEDIDEEDTETRQKESGVPSSPLEGSHFCAMGSLSELQDDSILVKGKRKAPKPPAISEPSKHPPDVPPRPPGSPLPQPPKSPSSPQPPRSPSSPPPPKHPPTTPPPKPPESVVASKLEMNETNEPIKDVSDDPAGTVEGDKSQATAKTKQSQQRISVLHPTIPPPPPPPKVDEDDPIIPKDGVVGVQGTASTTQSLIDDIPYMDENELYPDKANDKETKPQAEVSQYEIPEPPGKDGIPVALPLSPTILKQTALLLSGHRSVPFIDESDLPPDGPPPPPPTSPPETPHTSPPETPHTSPPETPCGSSPASPITIQVFSTSPKQTALNSLDLQSAKVATKGENQSHEEHTILTNANDSQESPPKSDSIVVESLDGSNLDGVPPPLPPKMSLSQTADSTSKAVASLASTSKAVASSSSTSKAVASSSSTSKAVASSASASKADASSSMPKENTSSVNQEDQSVLNSVTDDRYEIPQELSELAKESETTVIEGPGSAPEEPAEVAEERYEIPEVVKETALSIGPEGMPVRVGGPTHPYRMAMESVFGPPKPPRRRRNLSLPPPRPPKSLLLDEAIVPKLPPKAATSGRSASASTTASSFTTASSLMTRSPAGTPLSFQSFSKPLYAKPKSKTRRSWPLLFCDCMYANCRNYDDMQKK